MRVLITGASGFAGGYLAQACAQSGDDVTGVSRSGAIPPGAGEGRSLDLQDAVAVQKMIRELRPEVVYHLAALSSVGRSWTEPAETLQNNLTSASAMLEGLRLEAPGARIVWVSSCEVYGTSAHLPIKENAPLKPANPYAVSKAAGELLAGMHADAYGLNVICARPFNHAGPGQLPSFLLSSLARQAAEGRGAGGQSLRIVTGNPDTRRDFTDVRDTVRAYRLLGAQASGGIYNVCSGRSISAAEQVQLIAEILSPLEVEHIVDPARVRAHEVMDLRGANDRVRRATGWQPEIPFRRTMLETIEWWERELTAAAADGGRG